jgi:hypothetical protein
MYFRTRQGGAILPRLVRNEPIMRSGLLIPHYAPQLCWIDLDAGTSCASRKRVNDISMNQIEFQQKMGRDGLSQLRENIGGKFSLARWIASALRLINIWASPREPLQILELSPALNPQPPSRFDAPPYPTLERRPVPLPQLEL